MSNQRRETPLLAAAQPGKPTPQTSVGPTDVTGSPARVADMRGPIPAFSDPWVFWGKLRKGSGRGIHRGLAGLGAKSWFLQDFLTSVRAAPKILDPDLCPGQDSRTRREGSAVLVVTLRPGTGCTEKKMAALSTKQSREAAS